MLHYFVKGHPLICRFREMLLPMRSHCVDEDDKIVDKHPPQYEHYQPDVNISDPIMYPHFPTGENMGIARGKLSVRVLVALGACRDDVLFIDRCRRVEG